MVLIREWVITIVSIIIFATFMEILIPNSDYRRYINVVVGFLFIIVILTPLTKFIGGQINFEEEILKTTNQLELSTVQNRINDIQYSNTEAVLVLYKNKISKQIKDHIEYSTEYIVNKVVVEVEDNSDNAEFGSIKELSITLEQKTEDVEYVGKMVEPIQVNVSVGKKNNNTVDANSIFINNEGDSIKDDINNLYNISEDNINIYILRDN